MEADCYEATNKNDHTWKQFDEPKVYIVPGPDGLPKVVRTVAVCTVCGGEEIEEEKDEDRTH